MTPLAIVRSQDGYGGLHRALRARAEQLDVSRDTLNAISGLSYMQKLLAAVPIKGIGPKSLGPLLGALGVQLWIVQDEEVMASIMPRLVKRTPGHSNHANGKHANRKRDWQTFTCRGNPELARVLRFIGILKMTPKARSESARKAAIARWGTPAGKPTAAPRSRAPRLGRPRSAGNGAAKGPKRRR